MVIIRDRLVRRRRRYKIGISIQFFLNWVLSHYKSRYSRHLRRFGHYPCRWLVAISNYRLRWHISGILLNGMVGAIQFLFTFMAHFISLTAIHIFLFLTSDFSKGRSLNLGYRSLNSIYKGHRLKLSILSVVMTG